MKPAAFIATDSSSGTLATQFTVSGIAEIPANDQDADVAIEQQRRIGVSLVVALCCQCIPTGIPFAIGVEAADHLIQQACAVRRRQFQYMPSKNFERVQDLCAGTCEVRTIACNRLSQYPAGSPTSR